MFLPDLEGASYSVEFEQLDVLDRNEVERATRRAILSQHGVNLLMQRWVHHNTRVVVPTITIDAQIVSQFDEADLIAEAREDLDQAAYASSVALGIVEDWFGTRSNEAGPSWRQMLDDPQQRSVVRAAMRRQVRDWMADPARFS